MTTARLGRRTLLPVAVAMVGLVGVSGCTMEPEPLPVAGAIIVGTTDEILTLDPAGASDRGSLLVMANVYPHLLTTVAGSDEPVLDIALSAEFTSATEYTVVLKPGLTFANGNALSATDVKFSFDRITTINAEGGPARSFDGVSGIETPDDSTVVFTLRQQNDEWWPVVLASPAAAIVDEEVFDSNRLTANAEIVRGQSFAGQYVVETFREKDLVQLRANPGYGGVLDEPLSDTVNLRYYGNAANLLRAVRDGDVDLATRGFSAEGIASVASFDNLVVHTAPGSDIRFLAINPAAAPFTSGADVSAEKALAVRQAIADLIDRPFLVNELYEGAYEPLWSFAPASVREGDELLGLYGGADGAP
ncbi:MAG TPA: ABC transporter substrate-binding protein, partial [Terrimesophilobacter sp.]|nr:ABC transporter substrate-binding protein [Terrimesophilobacter sp.]